MILTFDFDNEGENKSNNLGSTSMKMGDWVVKSCKNRVKAYFVRITVWDAEALLLRS